MSIFKNRTVIGVICILLALVICFGITPLFNQSISQKAEIVRVTKDIHAGELITKDMVTTAEVGSYNLPSGLMTAKDNVVGKYAKADLAVGDYILAAKLSDAPAAENAYLYNLDGTKQAISVTIKSFATGLSGKLQSGDIVSVIVADYPEDGETSIPAELQYVEIISVTASTGYDANTGEAKGDEKELPSIRMDEYKRHRMERTLSAAGMDMTPEVYLAYTILKPAAALLAVIPCLLIFPLLSPIVVLLAILLYFKESRKAEEKVAERREKIEGELPRFVATVEQELGASRDVLTILENYKRHAGPDFARELDVLTADMRSSSYEAALVRFEGRLASPMLSDIVRGLIGVLRGDDGRVYFQMLSHDMKQLELQRLKAQAAKIPPKIRVYSFVMLVCFMLIYIVVILMQILTSMGGLFG